jgi:hypothetical protein
MIDALDEGRSSWHSFQVSYQGERPTEDVPSWMNESYDVWHRDPHKVIEDLLANTEFDGSFDYVPYQEFANGQRRWSDFMSGNWAWKQAACDLISRASPVLILIRRISSQRMKTPMDQCSYQSFSEATKRLFQWLRVTASSTRCICLSEM